MRSSKILIKGLILFCMIICSCSDAEKKSMISNDQESYWLIKYDEGKYIERPKFGYCFRSDGYYYAYHNYSKFRKPYVEGLYDISFDTNIVNYLFGWELKADSLYLNDKSFKVLFLTPDSMSLQSSFNSDVRKLYREKDRVSNYHPDIRSCP